ncbi:TetR/AcrR family transcriptional regulator, transcriptional repressor for nem operon [Bosea sp. CRIB-10]|uniref:TetR/AcrR family transcriptional regulator n=1 Tax=Bosea sp. CRIB-10 TaxID=378404 RepID=UPI0008E8B949|nr:TetR/AcrR family transcriptional regulator [Bosea sp. CRIB-10]SFD52437.1 TetR/AcrR family transcriptional regulator, transcriptional repressor for nem operon [Bosea sp. CRIB-10]
MGQPRQFDPEERLERALNAFWEGGFEGVGMQQLGKAMDLFPGSIYGTYGGKRALFLKAIDRYMATCSAEGLAVLDQRQHGFEAVRRYFAQLIDGILNGKRKWGCLVTNTIVELAESDPEIKEKADGHLRRLETAFSGALDRARQLGEISQDTSEDWAAYLVCVVQGLNVIAKTKPSRQRLEAVVSAALSPLQLPEGPLPFGA